MNTDNENPDDKLTDFQFIMKYQLQFTRHFGDTSGIYGVKEISPVRPTDEKLFVCARVRPNYQHRYRDGYWYEVPFDQFLTWRKNVKLLDFVLAKPK